MKRRSVALNKQQETENLLKKVQLNNLKSIFYENNPWIHFRAFICELKFTQKLIKRFCTKCKVLVYKIISS
jgi:hypothetical protein